ncbi:hypothetical protein GBA63_01310 [Rubrobacter tropicus]|uniref:Uncharacterized protein n=1 Tax=Rubrobacter tropicus TaxID=2653851 RepID=A0A6G8Q4M1_9ACTN|nr:hypothetical protein [Rubrobacter tropicus]QIN81415.1 hypothetical protein GBA63_01310 [Rubrobacter tropicus]
MDLGRNDAASLWEALARSLGGSFTARARGMVSPELTLLSARGEPFGHIRADKIGGTQVRAGDLSATIAPASDRGYRMTTGDADTLAAEPAGSATALRLRSGNSAYEANISPLRNSAVARSHDGEETVRVSGGFTNRRYVATFNPQAPGALPIAIFLLHHTFKLRREAYRTT